MLNHGSAVPEPAEAAAPQDGRVLRERYRLGRPIDHGRFGTIYRARDLHRPDGAHADLALLELPAYIGHDASLLEAFKRDFERVRALDHPNVLEVFDFDRDGDTYFATMEYVEATSLGVVFDHLDPTQPWAEQDLRLVRAVGEALIHAHSRGVVHGALRPEDVLITAEQRVKVSFISTCLTRSAPFSVQPRDDIYALACLTYRLLSGGAHEPGTGQKRIKGLSRRRWQALQRGLGVRGEPYASLRDFLLDLELRPGQGTVSRGGLVAAAVLGGAAALAYGGASLFMDPAAREARLSEAAARAEGAVATVAERAASLAETAESFAAQWRSTEADSSVTGADTPADPASPDADVAPAPEGEPAPTEAADAEMPPSDDAAPAAGGSPENATAAAAPDEPATPPPEPAATETERVATETERVASEPVATAPATAGADAASAASAIAFAGSTSAVSEGQGRVTIDIERTRGTAPASVAWWTSDGTAVAGDDYADLGRVVERFDSGVESLSITIPITSDAVAEDREVFHVHIGQVDAEGGEPVTLGQPDRVSVIIIDDDG